MNILNLNKNKRGIDAPGVCEQVWFDHQNARKCITLHKWIANKVGEAEHYRFKYLQEEAIPQKQECLEANEKQET